MGHPFSCGVAKVRIAGKADSGARVCGILSFARGAKDGAPDTVAGLDLFG